MYFVSFHEELHVLDTRSIILIFTDLRIPVTYSKVSSYFLRPRVRRGPLWYASHKNHHPLMFTRVCVDPSVDVCVQPKICDCADCPLWKRTNCAHSFRCVNRCFDLTCLTTLIHWFTTTYLSERLLIPFNNNKQNIKAASNVERALALQCPLGRAAVRLKAHSSN